MSTSSESTTPQVPCFDADLKTQELRVTFKGRTSTYVASELPGGVRDAFMNRMREKVELDDKSPGGARQDYTDHQTLFIVECLKDKETGKPPLVDEVRQWGTRTQVGISKICDDLNGVTVASQEAIKKN